MGKIKTRLIKRAGDNLVKKDLEFSEKFEENKKILGKEMPSKKIRNQLAGYLTRITKQKKKQDLEAAKAQKNQ